MWDKKVTKTVKRPGMKSGSRKKLYPQKGSGRARMGFIRSGSRVGGGKTMGTVPKDFRFFLNENIKVKGLKSMLSAKLAEGNCLIHREN